MEAQRMISIDMDNYTSSSCLTTSSLNSQVNDILSNYSINDCLSSKKFCDLLELFDKTVSNNKQLLAIICDRLGITEQHTLQIYQNKSTLNENFLKNLFEDCSKSKIKTFKEAIDFLEKYPEASFLVQGLKKDQIIILNQIQENRLELSGSTSKSSIRTDSSNDSDQFPKIYAFFVYYSEQFKTNSIRLNRLKEQIQKSNIILKDLDLTKITTDIKTEFHKLEQYPVFLVYDREIDNLIDFTKSIDDKYRNIYEFYWQVYYEYLNNNFNKRFHLFTLEDYDRFCSSGRFKYHWLLRKIVNENGEEQFLRPFQVPLYENGSDDVNLNKYLKFFERISRPFL